MTNIYCGVSDVPAKQRRGTQKECIEKKQIRYYGIEKIDKKLLDEHKKKKNNRTPVTRDEIAVAIAKERGTINRYKGRYEKAPKSIDKTKLDDYYNLWKAAEKRYNVLVKQFKKLETKTNTKQTKKKTKTK